MIDFIKKPTEGQRPHVGLDFFKPKKTEIVAKESYDSERAKLDEEIAAFKKEKEDAVNIPEPEIKTETPKRKYIRRVLNASV